MSCEKVPSKNSLIYLVISKKSYIKYCEKLLASLTESIHKIGGVDNTNTLDTSQDEIATSILNRSCITLSYLVSSANPFSNFISVEDFIKKLVYGDPTKDIGDIDIDNDVEIKENHDGTRSNLALLLNMDENSSWKDIRKENESLIVICLVVNKITKENCLTLETSILRNLKLFIENNVMAVLNDEDNTYQTLLEIDEELATKVKDQNHGEDKNSAD